jgi:hypothetical protein
MTCQLDASCARRSRETTSTPSRRTPRHGHIPVRSYTASVLSPLPSKFGIMPALDHAQRRNELVDALAEPVQLDDDSRAESGEHGWTVGLVRQMVDDLDGESASVQPTAISSSISRSVSACSSHFPRDLRISAVMRRTVRARSSSACSAWRIMTSMAPSSMYSTSASDSGEFARAASSRSSFGFTSSSRLD